MADGGRGMLARMRPALQLGLGVSRQQVACSFGGSMDYDEKRIEEAVLALLAAFNFDEGRSWKGFDFEVMDRLHTQGLIDDPKGKVKSIRLTPQGLEQGLRSAARLFGRQSSNGG